jgi:hypothetical protein
MRRRHRFRKAEVAKADNRSQAGGPTSGRRPAVARWSHRGRRMLRISGSMKTIWSRDPVIKVCEEGGGGRWGQGGGGGVAAVE